MATTTTCTTTTCHDHDLHDLPAWATEALLDGLQLPALKHGKQAWTSATTNPRLPSLAHPLVHSCPAHSHTGFGGVSCRRPTQTTTPLKTGLIP